MQACMDPTFDDLYELLRMAAYMKSAASKPVFSESAALFLGIAELLERRAAALSEPPEESEQLPAPPQERRRQPLNILT